MSKKEATDMRIKMIGYTFSESLKNVWRNRAMSLASLTSVAATLVILGMVFILITNINSMAQGAKDQFDTIQIYVKDEMSPDQIKEMGRNLTLIEGVKEVKFETKDEALKKFKADWGDNASLLDDLETNPLPNSYLVKLSDIGFSNFVVGEIKKLDGVEEVKFYQDVIEKMINMTTMIRNIGLAIITVLILVSTMIINNTIKLAVHARRREINIMKYVGATSWFVRWPFLLEGTILGFVGGVVALGIVFLGYNYVFKMFTSQFYVLIAAYIIDVGKMITDLSVLFLVIGAGIGALGSLMSMRKYLEV
jgi:cell division transport system permease protein